jgi:tetratricopeptide (TPR) repeat protein
MAWSLGMWDQAHSHLEAALSISRELHHDRLIARALTNLGTLEMTMGDMSKAERRLQEAAAYARTAGDRGLQAAVTGNLASVVANLGDDARAIELYEEAIVILRELERPGLLAAILADLSMSLERCERDVEALSCAQEALGLARTLGDPELLIRSLDALGSVLAKRGDTVVAAKLVGVADAVRTRTEYVHGSDSHHEELVRRLRGMLGQERYETTHREGQAMSLDDAVEYALTSSKGSERTHS